MTKPTAFYVFSHLGPRGRRIRTRYKLTPETAAVRLAGLDPLPVEATREIRNLPETAEEFIAWHTNSCAGPLSSGAAPPGSDPATRVTSR